MEFIDQLKRTVVLSKTPSRIVSLVPSQTELLVDLGLRNSIVGITKFCVHPIGLRENKAIVGGTKKVNFNKVKSLKPDVIICNKEENTEQMILQLENIAPVWISDIATIPESIEMIESLGEIFEVSETASRIIFKIKKEWNDFKVQFKNIPSKKVLYIIWKDPYMAAGKNTFIDALLDLNNFENIITEKEYRYPEVEIELFKSAELLLLSTEPYPFKKEHILEFQNETDADIALVNGEYFSWYGSRLIQAFEYFKTLH